MGVCTRGNVALVSTIGGEVENISLVGGGNRRGACRMSRFCTGGGYSELPDTKTLISALVIPRH